MGLNGSITLNWSCVAGMNCIRPCAPLGDTDAGPEAGLLPSHFADHRWIHAILVRGVVDHDDNCGCAMGSHSGWNMIDAFSTGCEALGGVQGVMLAPAV